jgi:hypothetical protein
LPDSPPLTQSLDHPAIAPPPHHPVFKSGALRACLASALLALLALLFVAKIQHRMRDFEVYWQAGTRARQAEPLYRIEDQHYQFKYLPAFAVLVSPLAGLPLPGAKAVWFAISVGMLAALLVLSLRLLPERRFGAGLLVGATGIAMAKFYGHELVLGQTNVLLAVLVLLALRQIRTGREVLAGLLLALSVVVKPYAIIFLPYVAIRRHFTALAAFGAFLGAALVLPAVSYGMEGNVALLGGWYDTVTGSTPPNLATQDNVSIAGMYAKWLGVGRPALYLSLATIGALALVCLVILRRRGTLRHPEYLEMSLLLTTIPLISPQGWDYVLLVSTPAVMCVVNYFDRLAPPFRLVVALAASLVAFSLYDLLGRALYSLFMSRSIVTVCYLALISSLYHLRARQVA